MPLKNMSPEILKKIRQTLPDQIANDLSSVQPVDFIKSTDVRSEQELVNDGYEPVDPVTKLIWIKKESVHRSNWRDNLISIEDNLNESYGVEDEN